MESMAAFAPEKCIAGDAHRRLRAQCWSKDLIIMKQIASQIHGVTSQEFESLLTMPSSDPKYQVFWFYHTLTRSQAIHWKWDWRTNYAVATEMLSIMCNLCKINAEKLEMGEAHVTLRTLLFWLCHYFYNEVRILKQKMPNASLKDLAFNTLDWWRLPIIL